MALSTLYLSHFPLAPQGLRGKNVAGKNVASFHPTNKSCHWVPLAAAAAHSKAAANEQPRMVPCLSSRPGSFLCFTVDSTPGNALGSKQSLDRGWAWPGCRSQQARVWCNLVTHFFPPNPLGDNPDSKSPDWKTFT